MSLFNFTKFSRETKGEGPIPANELDENFKRVSPIIDNTGGLLRVTQDQNGWIISIAGPGQDGAHVMIWEEGGARWEPIQACE